MAIIHLIVNLFEEMFDNKGLSYTSLDITITTIQHSLQMRRLATFNFLVTVKVALEATELGPELKTEIVSAMGEDEFVTAIQSTPGVGANVIGVSVVLPPTLAPTVAPSSQPSDALSTVPSQPPSSYMSATPSAVPSQIPSTTLSSSPTSLPSDLPSSSSSHHPSTVLSSPPSGNPSTLPTDIPSDSPISGECPPGFSDPGCSTFLGCSDPRGSICLNGGSCNHDNEVQYFNCHCPEGYFGVRCESTTPKSDWMRGGWGIGYRFNGGLFIEDPINQYNVDKPYNVDGLMTQLNTFPEASRPRWILINLSHPAYGDMYTSPHPILTRLNFGSTPYSQIAYFNDGSAIDPFEISSTSHPDQFDFDYDPPILKYDHFGRIATRLKEEGYKVSE